MQEVDTSYNRQDIIASIDIGTTKIVTIVANVPLHGNIEIIGVGKFPSHGLRKGLIVDLETTIHSIRESKNIAERMAGVMINKAYVGITGQHVQSIPSSAVVAVSDPHKGITAEDKKRVIEVAKKVDIPAGRRLIDVLVREYIVDGHTGIKDPLGMSGLRLEVNALLVTGALNYFENIYRAVEAAEVEVAYLFLEPVASGEAVLTNDEKDSGVVLLDIGGGTTDIAIYQDSCIAHTSVIPVGGDHFDSDISYGLGIPVKEAERIKIMMGGVDRERLNSQDIIEVTKSGNGEKQNIPVKIIAEIILPRMEELLQLVQKEITRTGFQGKIPAGLVMTGGGSQLKGVVDLSSSMFSMPVRVGRPHNIAGLREDVQSPIFSTGVGLLKLARQRIDDSKGGTREAMNMGSWSKIWDKFVKNLSDLAKWYWR